MNKSLKLLGKTQLTAQNKPVTAAAISKPAASKLSKVKRASRIRRTASALYTDGLVGSCFARAEFRQPRSRKSSTCHAGRSHQEGKVVIAGAVMYQSR
jgi:hypothetical protein